MGNPWDLLDSEVSLELGLEWHLPTYNYTFSPKENIMVSWVDTMACGSVYMRQTEYSLVTQWSPTLCDPMDYSTPGFPVHHQFQSLLKLMSIKSVMPSNHLILCHPLLLLPSIFPSIRVFSNESVLHIKWPKYWNFTVSISPSNEYSGLISFSFDWLDLLSVQGIVKSLQHHGSKASILRSAFFIVQLSHPYITTGKTIALTRRTLRQTIWKLNQIEGQWEVNVWASGLCLL